MGKKVPLKLYVVCCAVIALFYSFNFNYYGFETNCLEIDKVLDVVESYENYCIVGSEKEKYLIYNNNNEFRVGNKVLFKGNLVNIRNGYNSFYNYLNKNNVNYELEYYEFEIIDYRVKTNEVIVDNLLSNKSESSKSYLKLILFNVKDENNRDFYSNFSLYSLTYLIAVSGFHINLLLSFFRRIFHNNCIGIILVSFYLYLLDFSVSSYRAFLCYVFKKINKKLDFEISNLEVISLIGSVFIIFNPSVMFSFGFIYSFLATLVLEIFRLYKVKKFVLMLYVYAVNLPILLISYYKLNLCSLFYSIILSPLISFLYIFSFLFLFFDKFYLFYELVVFLFHRLFNVLNKFNVVLIFGKPSVFFVIVYYLFLITYFIFKERKNKIRYIYACIVFLLIIYQYYKPIIFYNEQVYFLNVGQGDCSVFFVPNSKEVVLVDTGGSKYRDMAKTEIIPFLESKGINKIREVILTHDDFDHSGALNSLKDNFSVGNIIDDSLVEEIVIGNKLFKNLNVSDNRDNDGSIVLYGEYAGYKLLLMGDASIKIEREVLSKVNTVDIIKIGHHGSSTSSSYEFLDGINGKIAIISVGEDNIYGHPSEEVLNTLRSLNYIILRTDENNDIGFGKNIFKLGFIDYFN